jgi:toxin ParE1/3/4
MSDPRVVRTARAENDLIEIWRYIAREDAAAADRVLDRLDRKTQLVATRPYLGRPRADILPGLRQTSLGKYLIFYRLHPEGGIEVLRYFHAARLLSSLLDAA